MSCISGGGGGGQDILVVVCRGTLQLYTYHRPIYKYILKYRYYIYVYRDIYI